MITPENILHYRHAETSDWEGGDTTFQPLADVKLELKLADAKRIQAAGFHIHRGELTEYHACISTQAGCKFACRMCVSGRNGFSRNLTAEEIVSQIEEVAKKLGVAVLDHVVFMGIGEPLDNYGNFCQALRELNERGYERRLSFATVGNPTRLRRFAQEGIAIRMLWLSLHAPDNQKRQEIMPVAKAFPVWDLIDAGISVAWETKAEVRVNYLVYRGFNDSRIDARNLAGLLRGTETYLTLQLTEPNDVPFGGYPYGRREDIERFRGYLEGEGLKNRMIRFLASGKPLQAGCGEFAYSPG